jgi:flavorubredoxin
MVREIAPGVHWIQECGPDRSSFLNKESPPGWYEPGRNVHIPQNVYLFVGRESLIFDTLSPASTDQLLDEVHKIVGHTGLDYVVVSHPDLPHAGNAMELLREFPDATLVAPRYGSRHELYHLDEAIHVGEGDSIDIGGHIFDFHEAYILDAPIHIWMTERNRNWLMPVDWFGFPHQDSECMKCVHELDHDVTVQRLVEFHGRVLFWYQYVDVDKMADLHRFLLRKFDPDGILSGHGLPIIENTDRYLDMMDDVVAEINSKGRIGTLG